MPNSPADPRCPRCGEPPRVEMTLAYVRRDYYTKKVLHSEGQKGTVTYECGGGHRWAPPDKEEG